MGSKLVAAVSRGPLYVSAWLIAVSRGPLYLTVCLAHRGSSSSLWQPGKPLSMIAPISPKWMGIIETKPGGEIPEIGHRLPSYKECIKMTGRDMGHMEDPDLEAACTPCDVIPHTQPYAHSHCVHRRDVWYLHHP